MRTNSPRHRHAPILNHPVSMANLSPVMLCGILFSFSPAEAGVKADFIDGSYVLYQVGCDKLKALGNGTSPSVTTQPWVTTSEGISYWEGGCHFTKITKLKHQRWRVIADCGEEAEGSSIETYEYHRTSPTTFSVKLTTPGTTAKQRPPVTYLRCDLK